MKVEVAGKHYLINESAKLKINYARISLVLLLGGYHHKQAYLVLICGICNFLIQGLNVHNH